MSMLAEPKKKTRITLNPRGTLWTNDENKFGQKLLEKMGWTKGKGLGKEEQGSKEPIKVSVNSNNKGMGYKGNPEDYSLHYQGFEDVLTNLNSLNSTNNSTDQNLSSKENALENVESLEVKSKNLKSRVHYKKFTKAKDLSRYNEDDLACVLGSKKASKKEEIEDVAPDTDMAPIHLKTEIEVEQMDKNQGLITVYGGNLKDYFAQKMAELKRKREEGLLGDGNVQTPNQSKRMHLDYVPNTPVPDLQFEPERTEFSFNISVQEPEPQPEPEHECEIENSELKSKKKKKKKSKDKDLEIEEVLDEFDKMKKKRNKDKKEKSQEYDKENHIFKNEMNENSIEEIYICNEAVEEESNKIVEECTKKKKKRKRDDVEAECNTQNDNVMNISNNIEDEVSSKKKKKKKKDKNERDEVEIIDVNSRNSEEINSSQISEEQHLSTDMNESYVKATSKEGKKKKKRERIEEEEEEEEKDKSDSHKPFKKLRKLASEISLTDILKGKGDKSEIRNSLIVDPSTVESELTDEVERKPKVKLTSKRSFKEFKTDLEEKIKRRIKKKDKKDMEAIEEEEDGKDANPSNDQVAIEDIDSTSVVIKVPIRVDENNYYSIIKEYKSVNVNVENLFPGSNLLSVKGYRRNKF